MLVFTKKIVISGYLSICRVDQGTRVNPPLYLKIFKVKVKVQQIKVDFEKPGFLKFAFNKKRVIDFNQLNYFKI